MKFSDPNFENCRRRYIFSGAFLLKILIWDNWSLVYFLSFFTYKTANFWGIDHKSSENMHFICICHITKGLNFRIFFEFFTIKLLLKEQIYVYLKNLFFGHISVNFCPILKIFGTVTIRKTRSLSWAHLLIDQINIKKNDFWGLKVYQGLNRHSYDFGVPECL